MEPEIVSIAPTDPPSKSAVSIKQQQAQLQAIERDVETYLPELDKAILNLLQAINSLEPEALSELAGKKLKDVTGALSSLMEKRNLIANPRQVNSGSKKKLRILFGKDQGVEISE